MKENTTAAGTTRGESREEVPVHVLYVIEAYILLVVVIIIIIQSYILYTYISVMMLHMHEQAGKIIAATVFHVTCMLLPLQGSTKRAYTKYMA